MKKTPKKIGARSKMRRLKRVKECFEPELRDVERILFLLK
jgi:hypothetical protein